MISSDEKNLNRYCNNIKDVKNYNVAINDSKNIYDCHHRLETHNSNGNKRLVNLSVKELKALGMYYNRPPEEFIFLPHKDHLSLHLEKNKYWLGKKHKQETKNKQSKAHKGKKNPMYGIASPSSKKVKLVEFNIIFNTIEEASKFVGFCNVTISRAAKYKKPTKKKNLHFEFI